LIYGYGGLDMTRRDLQADMREKKQSENGKSFANAAPIAPIHPVATTVRWRAVRSRSTSTASGGRAAT
jgi:2-keto-4-pentenoate hydratase/2-oxohepta-3-ene-1,7-dioic acid hydratase in catechol pathway